MLVIPGIWKAEAGEVLKAQASPAYIVRSRLSRLPEDPLTIHDEDAVSVHTSEEATLINTDGATVSNALAIVEGACKQRDHLRKYVRTFF